MLTKTLTFDDNGEEIVVHGDEVYMHEKLLLCDLS